MTDLLRSWMFVPGNKQRFLNKAASSQADAVFLDLEDGVLPEAKSDARAMVASTLGQRWKDGPLRYVRLNALDTPWFDEDVAAVVTAGLDGVCLPKAESAEMVIEVAARLEHLESQAGLDAGSIRIVAAIESAAALLAAPSIAAAHSRVQAVVFGAEDYALDVGLGSSREGEAAELLYARSAVVVAAVAARVLSIDGVFPDLGDADGLRRDVWSARRLGFSGKSTFHPRQVDVINSIFLPQPDEIDSARRVVEAFEAAQEAGEASVAVGGQLVDLPIVRRAQRIVRSVGEH